MSKVKDIIKNNYGDFIRIGSALGVAGSASRWYNGIKDHVLNEVIKDIGNGLTDSIDIPFGLYGLGETINVCKDIDKDIKNEERATILEWTGRSLRLCPLFAPYLAYISDGDFFKSILAPATACIAGYGFEYVGKMFRKEK